MLGLQVVKMMTGEEKHKEVQIRVMCWKSKESSVVTCDCMAH